MEAPRYEKVSCSTGRREVAGAFDTDNLRHVKNVDLLQATEWITHYRLGIRGLILPSHVYSRQDLLASKVKVKMGRTARVSAVVDTHT